MSISFGSEKVSRNEFVIPALQDEYQSFFGLKSRNNCTYAALTYTGQEITTNDVFARLVDSGQKIESVDQTVQMLEAYLQMLQEYRIGNVLAIESIPDEPGFKLKKIANRPTSTHKKLP